MDRDADQVRRLSALIAAEDTWLLARSVMGASQLTAAQARASSLSAQLTDGQIVDSQGRFSRDTGTFPTTAVSEWLERLDVAAPADHVREARQLARDWCCGAAPRLPTRAVLSVAGALAMSDPGP